MELLSRETRTVFTLHQPIYNMATGYSLPANRLIPVQFAKMQNGFNSNSVATRTTLDGMENGIKENEKVVFYRCTTFRKWVPRKALHSFANAPELPFRTAPTIPYADRILEKHVRFYEYAVIIYKLLFVYHLREKNGN